MNDPNTSSLTDERACPDCAETIKIAAKVCKHCGLRFEEISKGNAASDGNPTLSWPERVFGIAPAKFLAGCGLILALPLVGLVTVVVVQQSQSESRAMPTKAVPAIEVQPDALSKQQLANVCRAGLAHVMLKDAEIMRVMDNSGGVVRIQYRRPDDGKIWKDDCRVDGDRIIWRAVDAFPGSGAGRWRDTADDGLLTYRILGNQVTVTENFGDGARTDTFSFESG